MTGTEIRRRFLEYFAAHGHQVVASSSLAPHDDPTLLFTNAGMVQFKRLFMGEEKREYVRAVSSQRCVRAGGKHNDLDNVGYTARHHTFFEMLGNFSFGDYFKKEAIRFAWDFLVDELGIDRDRLWISVFDDDDEAFDIWEKDVGVARDRIVRMGEKDNFWAMGDTGPCGPCSEIHFDQGPEVGCGLPGCKVECECDRYLEIWNLVFMQFNRGEDGKLMPLPRPSIDTGMGLERVAAVTQGKLSNYDSDIFSPILACIGEIAGVGYGTSGAGDTAMRVIADHARATAHLVADGVFPSNEGRGYVLRRIMRRAIRYGRELGLGEPFFSRVTAAVVHNMAAAFPHLRGEEKLLAKVVDNEEERFLVTIDHGLELLHEEISRLGKAGDRMISGAFIFKLYDTYGFPVDIVRDIAMEQGMNADEDGFLAAMAGQKEQSRRSWKGAALAGIGREIAVLAAKGAGGCFVGYDRNTHKSRIIAILSPDGENILKRAGTGEEVLLVADETPFYAEGGGQACDIGEIKTPDGVALVFGTVNRGGVIVHQARVDEGMIGSGVSAVFKVDRERRRRIAANHTATHLLQAALRQVLGDHVRQAGSVVDSARLRFDFSHFSPMTTEEIHRVEDIVNREIRHNRNLAISVVSRDEAAAAGATALFGEKYGDEVRMVSVPEFSLELCGGTHVSACGDIGIMRIVSETGVAAGVRRIEAVTGSAALFRVREEEAVLHRLADSLKTPVANIPDKVDKLKARIRDLEREVARLAGGSIDPEAILAEAVEVGGVKVAAVGLEVDSPKTLRELGDRIRELGKSGVVVLGAECKGKAALLALVSDDLKDRCPAGKIIKKVAALVGGGGGGRADMAQAGGSRPEKLAEAMAAVETIVAEML